MLIFVHHYREVGTAKLTPAATGTGLRVRSGGETIVAGGEDIPGTECDADAALLAPPFVDVDPVHIGTARRLQSTHMLASEASNVQRPGSPVRHTGVGVGPAECVPHHCRNGIGPDMVPYYNRVCASPPLRGRIQRAGEP